MSLSLESEAGHTAFPIDEIDRQLSRLLESHHFCRSSRYPALLQFLVQQAQMGNAAKLKERLIGIEVFHRVPTYDTNTDPVVRVTAAEVRKKIAQYYQEPEHLTELRIDLPIGSYVPRFLPAQFAHYSGETASLAAALDPSHLGDDLPREHREATSTPIVLPEPEGARHPAMRGASRSADLPSQSDDGLAKAASQDSQFTLSRKRVQFSLRAALLAGVVLASAFLATSAWRNASETRALHQLWAPLNAQGQVLFVIGDHSLDENGHSMGTAPVAPSVVDTVFTQVNRRSQVPLEDSITLDKIHSFLTRDSKIYRDKGAAESSLGDLRSGPVVLFAGFDNRWSVQLSQQLPFRLVPDLDHNIASIVDRKSPSQRWILNFSEPVNQIASDYGIVARYYDPMLENNVLIVAGIGSMGTAAATEFVTEERFSREILKAAPADWKNGNFEIVLGAPVVDGQAGPPRIIASAYW